MTDPALKLGLTRDDFVRAAVPGNNLEPAQAIAMMYQIASQVDAEKLQEAVHSSQALNQISTAIVSKAVALIEAVGAEK